MSTSKTKSISTNFRLLLPAAVKIRSKNHGLKRHIGFVHEYEKMFVVKFVVRNFQQAARYVHGKSGDFVCVFCDNRFLRDCDKVLHERMHAGEKSYQCDDCGRAFHRKETLKRHKNSLH